MTQQSVSKSWRQGLIGFFFAGALLIGITQFTIREDRPAVASTVVAVRDVLVEGSPEAAGGQVLQLVQYDIPAGVVLPMHTHPGMQLAWIESGVLTYHVVEGGSIPVTRAAHDGTPEATELLAPGETTELHPGDSVSELDGVVHYGENLGPDPVVILAATLLDPNEPASVVWTPVATPAASPVASPAS
jgi:quercetin dioxygenase-like cupin family protein